MADPITAGIAIGAVTSAVAATTTAVSQYQQAGEEKTAANYNATLEQQQAKQAENAGAANEAEALRKNSTAVGSQAAGFGESNIGTGRTVEGVERQSQTYGRMDALNQWYAGEIEGTNAQNQANYQTYLARVAGQNQTNAVIGGGIGVGTSALMAGAKYGTYNSGGPPALGGFNMGAGSIY